jgi:hypothetical protein
VRLVKVRLCELRVNLNCLIKVFKREIILLSSLIKQPSFNKHDLVFILDKNDLRQLLDCISELIAFLKYEGEMVPAFYRLLVKAQSLHKVVNSIIQILGVGFLRLHLPRYRCEFRVIIVTSN